MTVHMVVPYSTSGQELGETRQALTKGVMKRVEQIINFNQKEREKYYILVHGKPMPGNQNFLFMKYRPFKHKPPMMLSCLLFGVDNEKGELTLEWALPGDWPTWSVGGSNEPVPETIASINEAGVRYHYDDILSA